VGGGDGAREAAAADGPPLPTAPPLA
jgi:hypothetical protein